MFLYEIDKFDCSIDKCHLAWLIRDNKNLLNYVKDGTCTNGTAFTALKVADYAKCN